MESSLDTMGPQRKFTGSVVATGGKLHDLKRIDVEEERRVLYPGRTQRVVGPHGRTHVGGGRAPVVVERKQTTLRRTATVDCLRCTHGQ